MDWCDIVTDNDAVVGRERRSVCHGNPELIHRAVHVLVFNSREKLLLQKRSPRKRVQPGRWDSSVGGHVEAGETYLAAAYREMKEELGIRNLPLTFLYSSTIRNAFESENIVTYLARHDGKIDFCRSEIDAVRFWSPEEIEAELGSGLFTPNFEEEWRCWLDWNRRCHGGDDRPVRLCGGDAFPDLVKDLLNDPGESR